MKHLSRFFGIAALVAAAVFAFTACSDGGDDGPPPPPPYIITGSGTSFTVTSPSGIELAGDDTMANVISAIRVNAEGADVHIQFGADGEDLDTASTPIIFNDTNGDWGGHITLRGNISSTGASNALIQVGNGVSVTSNVDITGIMTTGMSRGASLTGNGNLTIAGGTFFGGSNPAVNHNGTGLLTITGGIFASNIQNGSIILQHEGSRMHMSGGTVRTGSNNANQATISVASNHENAVVISGGIVGSMDSNNAELQGMAIRSTGTGGITIRGNALITSMSASNGTIRLQHASGGSLRIEGGSVRNTSANGPAITRTASQTVTHTGGTINPMPEWLE